MHKSVMRKETDERPRVIKEQKFRQPQDLAARKDRETAHAPLRIPLPEQLHGLLQRIPLSDARDVFRECLSCK